MPASIPDKPLNEIKRDDLLHLQMIIEQALLNAELLFKWKTPFFYVDKRPICYLNQTKDYVDVGFWNATHLTVFQEFMTADGRKMIKSLRYESIEAINDDVLTAVVKETYEIREKNSGNRFFY
ncbi:hypothetical protein APS56_05800 [Pseudalgibacter alginicilyticus]|uniref:YdhG-like domain-containing protein n=1 Tax=Pseudalgibacter alginicilyticus TaxID=1736674 RepID=A0A0P0D3Q3_9FLAO|nr:DUF1801 domain-containing protein [Pseudalgibacter alginicilyticus]ALJ04676.1 hypothetical protein APS56_05800 [Pseudalgibacter alginicilyticus]